MAEKVFCSQCKHYWSSYGLEGCKVAKGLGKIVEDSYKQPSYRPDLLPSEQNANNDCNRWERKTD